MSILKRFKKIELRESHAQVSLEVLTGVIILILMMVMIIGLNAARDLSTELLGKKLEAEKECNKVAGILSNLNASKANGEITFTVSEDFNVNENKVIFENWECNFYGTVSETNLVKGKVRVVKNSSGIVISNV